jgi:hypothetical protein
MNEPPVQSRTSGIENLNARTDDENNAADKEEESQNTPSTKKPSMETKLKRWWAGVGLDPITALMMMK